jgi:hypothetical protein
MTPSMQLLLDTQHGIYYVFFPISFVNTANVLIHELLLDSVMR